MKNYKNWPYWAKGALIGIILVTIPLLAGWVLSSKSLYLNFPNLLSDTLALIIGIIYLTSSIPINLVTRIPGLSEIVYSLDLHRCNLICTTTIKGWVFDYVIMIIFCSLIAHIYGKIKNRNSIPSPLINRID